MPPSLGGEIGSLPDIGSCAIPPSALRKEIRNTMASNVVNLKLVEVGESFRLRLLYFAYPPCPHRQPRIEVEKGTSATAALAEDGDGDEQVRLPAIVGTGRSSDDLAGNRGALRSPL